MTQSLTVIQDDRPRSGSEEFNERQLAEAYGTISNLKLKLELGVRDLGHLYDARRPSGPPSRYGTIEDLLDTSISDRARRSDTLPASLFADPAWDMMLDLYRAELHQYRVSVSSLCIASQVPASTALRWIGRLERERLVVREADPFDRRRYYLRLTSNAVEAMFSYFSPPHPAQEAHRCAR